MSYSTEVARQRELQRSVNLLWDLRSEAVTGKDWGKLDRVQKALDKVGQELRDHRKFTGIYL